MLAQELTDFASVVLGQIFQGQVFVLLAAPLQEHVECLQIVLAKELLDLTYGGDLPDFIEVFVVLDPVVDGSVVIGGENRVAPDLATSI